MLRLSEQPLELETVFKEAFLYYEAAWKLKKKHLRIKWKYWLN